MTEHQLSPQAYMLKTQVLVGALLWEVLEDCRRLGLSRTFSHSGCAFEVDTCFWFPPHSLLSVLCEVSSFSLACSYSMRFCPGLWGQELQINASETVTPINISSEKLQHMHCGLDDIKMHRQQTGRLQAKLFSAQSNRFGLQSCPTFSSFLQKINRYQFQSKIHIKICI